MFKLMEIIAELDKKRFIWKW